MSSDLERFRDHARAMAQPGAHVDSCHATTRYRHGVTVTNRPDPSCCGCVPDAERALWKQLADEIETYRNPVTGTGLAGLFDLEETTDV